MFGYSNAEERKHALENIIRTEWDMFQKVNNIGGRADCQNDWNTFYIMRYSHYNPWTDQLLKSYEKDLETAIRQNRNLIMEKYAFMMEVTNPSYYKKELEPNLPTIDMETMFMIQEITDYLVSCEKEIASRYPKLSSAGRTIEAAENEDFTSVETYAMGEMKTYSKNTLGLYLDYVRVSRAVGKNIVLAVKEEMVKRYGYASLEDAENKMQY